MRTSLLSAADLVDCYHKLGQEGLAHAARLMGMTQQRSAKQEPAEKPTPPTLPAFNRERALAKPPPPPTTASMNGFAWHVTRKEPTGQEVNLQTPPWFKNAVVTKPGDTEGDPLAMTLRKKPLVPWSQCWPVLKQVLGCWQEQGAPDLDRVVDLLARGEAVVNMPRQRRTNWAAHALVLVDFSRRMEPFRDDIHQLIQSLLDLRGAEGLKLMYCKDHPAQGWFHWHTHKPIPAPSVPWGMPVLAISDLGLPDAGASWLRLGEKLRQQGATPVALAPISPLDRRESPWTLYFWDRGSPLKPDRPGPGPSEPGTETLMSLLAPAVRVEPGLLRAMRYLLPVDQSSAADERAVWLHADIRSCPIGFDFEPKRVDHWRSRFQTQDPPERREQALALIRQHHTHLPKTVIEEERWVSQTLAGHMPNSKLLADLLKNVTAGHTPTLNWLKRMVSRQHNSIWDHPQMASAMLLAQKEVHGDDVENWRLPPGFDLNRAGWLLNPSTEPKPWTLVQYGQCRFRFLLGKVTETDKEKPLAVCTSRTGIFQLVAAEDTRQIVLDKGREFTVNSATSFQVRGDQVALTVTQVDKPSWAKSFSLTKKGMAVTTAQDRRLIWVPPRGVPVYTDGGSVETFQRNHGCWMDEHIANQLQKGLRKPEWADEFGLDQRGIFGSWSFKGHVQQMRLIWPGSFWMGSPESEPGRGKDETLHQVVLSRTFWLAATPCSQGMWQAMMHSNPSAAKGTYLPVTNIGLHAIQNFFQRLKDELRITATRLPSEAEWEYACRAGSRIPFRFGTHTTPTVATDNPDEFAVHGPSSSVATKLDSYGGPIPWGLHQMHGNVQEWTSDHYGLYPKEAVVDPKGNPQGKTFVLRGGSSKSPGRDRRSAARTIGDDQPKHDAGFRLVIDWE